MLSIVLAAALPCIDIATMPPMLRVMMIETVQIFPMDVPGSSFIWHFAPNAFFAVNVSAEGCITSTIPVSPKLADEIVRLLGDGI